MGHARNRGSRGWVTARGHPATEIQADFSRKFSLAGADISGVASPTVGDTLKIAPERVGLHGIDASGPALRCRAGGETRACGAAATRAHCMASPGRPSAPSQASSLWPRSGLLRRFSGIRDRERGAQPIVEFSRRLAAVPPAPGERSCFVFAAGVTTRRTGASGCSTFQYVRVRRSVVTGMSPVGCPSGAPALRRSPPSAP